MDISDTSPHTGPRPKSLRCVQCNKWFKVKPVGAIGMYCSGKCKQAAFQMKVRLTRPKPEPKPKQPKVSLEDRVAMRVYQMLLDSNVIVPVDKPKPEPEDEQ